MDLNNFVIDRVLRGIALSQSDGSVLFSINQITNPSLSCTSESKDAVDALGVPVATFYRAKNAEFKAENAIFDMNLLATQVGATKRVASAISTITAPMFETIDINGTSSTYTLAHTPKTAPSKIYKLNSDSTLGTPYAKGTSASATEFTISTTTLTPPTGLVAGDKLFVIYDYEATSAVAVANSADKFPTGCKFIMQVLGCDVCDQTSLIYAYLIFPNAKLSPDFDWTIATESTHPFSMKAQQAYCSSTKKLFEIVIPE